MMVCSLCGIRERDGEIIHYDGGEYLIVETKDKKGHRQRVMLVHERHGPIPSDTARYLEHIFKDWCRVHFTSPTVAILHDLYSSVPEHYHIVASDWEGDDIDQMHRTPLLNIETRQGEHERK